MGRVMTRDESDFHRTARMGAAAAQALALPVSPLQAIVRGNSPAGFRFELDERHCVVCRFARPSTGLSMRLRCDRRSVRGRR